MIGMHGSRVSNLAAQSCDLLIAVGCRFSDRVTGPAKEFCSKAKIVHLDIDRAEVDKNICTHHHIIGDIRDLLTLLNRDLPQYSRAAWKKQVMSNQKTDSPADASGLTPRQVVETVQEIAGQAILTTDVGQHQMWTAQYFRYTRPRQLITSGGFGTMGFGLGAAGGAALGNPDRKVVHMTGDGSFRMNAGELSTVRRYGLPVITVVFNNRALGMVRQWQTLMYRKRYSETDLGPWPDFVKLADAYDIQGWRVETKAEFEAAFSAAVASGKAALIDCRINSDELVRPMAMGSSISDFLLD
jgi:acetolactate synthase-1/2/3 large subunit